MRLAVKKLPIENVEKLQALVVENFDAIEQGLTVLDARLLLGHATIDVIGVDAGGALVLGAVGFTANEEMLLKAVEAYSWCLEYPQALARLYPSCQVSENRPPRLLFVVERVPDAFHRKIKQLGFPEVDCVEFRHLEFHGVAAVYFETLLRLRRSVTAVSSAVAPGTPTAASSSDPAGENVITMTGSAPRSTTMKPPKLLTPVSPEATAASRATERTTTSRESAPVVSIVSRQSTVPARIEEPWPVPEPLVLREPEPLVGEPTIEAAVSGPVGAGSSLDAPIPAGMATLETEPVTLRGLPELSPRPAAPSGVPVMPMPANATVDSAETRVSFKDLAATLLGATSSASGTVAQVILTATAVEEPSVARDVVDTPRAIEPIAAPIEIEPKRIEMATATRPLHEIAVAAAEMTPVELLQTGAAVDSTPEPPSLTVEALVASAAPAAAPGTQQQIADPARQLMSTLPQGFEGLNFPNDGVLTRQWMEFLSQMSATK